MPDLNGKKKIHENSAVKWVVAVVIPLVVFWWQISARMDKRIDERIQLNPISKQLNTIEGKLDNVKEGLNELKQDFKEWQKYKGVSYEALPDSTWYSFDFGATGLGSRAEP